MIPPRRPAKIAASGARESRGHSLPSAVEGANADLFPGGFKVIFYGGVPVKVPPMCCCCMAPMTKAMDVLLVTSSVALREHFPLPMPYCDVCQPRAARWKTANSHGWVLATFVFFGLLGVAGFISWYTADNLAELLALIAPDIVIAVGGGYVTKRLYQGTRQLPGHVPYCNGVRSPAEDAFEKDGRLGGTLVFANWKFGLGWAKLNGVAQRTQPQPHAPHEAGALNACTRGEPGAPHAWPTIMSGPPFQDWAVIFERARSQRAAYQQHAPAARGIFAHAAQIVLVGVVFAAMVIATLALGGNDVDLGILLAAVACAVVGGWAVFHGMQHAIVAGGAMRRIRDTVRGKMEHGRFAALVELTWQDAHRWGPVDYFEVGKGADREGFRTVVVGQHRDVPVLVSVAYNSIRETWGSLRFRMDRSAIYAARPGRPDRLVRPDVSERLAALGLTLHVGPYGLCASAPSTRVKTVAALEHALPLLTAPAQSLFIVPHVTPGTMDAGPCNG